MKKNVFTLLAVLIVLVIVTGPAFGHTLFMNLTDNEDGTVIRGRHVFHRLQLPQIFPCNLLDENERQILKIKLDENGEAEFNIPDQPYTVFLDGGPGHTVREDGPIKQQ